MFDKNKKEEYVEQHGILNLGKDYHVYHMTKRDILISYAIGMVIGVVVAASFFGSIIFALICGIVCAIFAPKIWNNYKREQVQNNLKLQFKDLLDSLNASYLAGKNTTNAFKASEKDMISIYGETADIVNEVQIINTGLENNINIETMLLDLAERSGLDDIKTFASVFEVCNRQGGNLKNVVSETRDILNDKIEVEMEIDTLLTANKNDLNILTVMPIVVVIMLNGLGSGTITQNTVGNVVLKIICLGIFVAAYLIGKKITDIKM